MKLQNQKGAAGIPWAENKEGFIGKVDTYLGISGLFEWMTEWEWEAWQKEKRC